MLTSFNGTPTKRIYINGIEIKSVYFMNYLVWSNKTNGGGDIASCYATGVWLDDYPWTDNTAWPN
jgi:hypothetical protein